VGASFVRRSAAERQLAEETRICGEHATAVQLAIANRDVASEGIVSSGDTWSDVLQEMDLDPQTVFNVSEAARKVFNLRRIAWSKGSCDPVPCRRTPFGELSH